MKYLSWLRNKVKSPNAGRPIRTARNRAVPADRFGAEVQLLEQRALLSGFNSGHFAVTDLVRSHTAQVGPHAQGAATPSGYTPTQIRHAYGFDQIVFNGTPGNGAGTTIAIVDAYDDPNIANDLHQFDLAFGLPDAPSFTKVNQTGSTSNLPVANAGWIGEIALDVEWAHAIAPGASILLVEANSNSYNDLFTAVSTAGHYAGVVAVSMSWGGGEFSGENVNDSLFTTPAGHTGVTFVASSGDTGAPTSYPSASPNVVSVGGTTLIIDAGNNWNRETAWSGSGGGISADESQPAYQNGIVTQTGSFRADPDVAYDADPNTGFPVYDSYNNGTASPWGQWGGTSDAAPQWAALMAIADQGRVLAGKGSLDGATQTLPLLYGMSSNDFHDIVSGASTGSPQYTAGSGYDLVTGRGSPIANRVVNDLVGNLANVPPTLTMISTLGMASQPYPFSISYATLLGASNAQDSNGAIIQFRISGVQNGSLTITHNGVTASVVPGTTLFGPGNVLTWTGVPGVAVPAFSVTAFDGTLSSSTAVQVKINVQSPGAAFDLAGPWIVNSSSGSAVGLGQIVQIGANLTLTNPGGVSSAGTVSSNHITATNFDNVASLVGTIDTTAADHGRIVWADGSVWLRVSLGGQYAVSTPGSNTLTLALVSQSGSSLTLINGSTVATAVIASTSGLQVTAGGSSSTATYGDGKIAFNSNGQIWTKLDLPPDYNNPGGATTHVIQNGTAGLVFVDKFGNTSPGYWLTPTQVFATGWNESGTVGLGKITWADGTVWSENLALKGARNGSGTTTIAAAPSQIMVTDYTKGNGATVHVIQTGTTNLVFVDSLGNMVQGSFINSTQATSSAWAGDIATFNGNQVNWSDGTVWTKTSTSASTITVTDYTNPNGIPVHMAQNGTNTLVFVDGLGNTSLGSRLSATSATAVLYPGDLATLGSATVIWSDGTAWTQTANPPPLITATDANSTVSHLQLPSASSVNGLNGTLSGLCGTRQNGQIVWSDGTIWDDFDFNALNALFEMATGYP